ncbi:lipopolysaccharide biosynthesis protein [Candidatus Ventrimonas sp.]|uniref:lipopolysaccharide biosynthesis protein n=1 Tax=Candidatus Ventrimonas sp. TaxID=3048889 RepID=UPI003AB53251
MKHWTHLLMKTGLSLEKENMIWNMTGSFFYAFASMVLSFLVLRIAGEEQGGIFSFGFSTVGQQMFLLAYFGIRPFHITDGTNQYRFGDYLHHRYVTCAMALLLGAGYLACIGYSWQKAQIIFLLIVYKVIDGFADVYESEFQRQGCLYLTGRSNTFRTILSVGIFLATLISGAGLFAACAAAVLGQIAGVVLFDIVVLRELKRVDYGWSAKQGVSLTASSILLFVSVFLDFYIFSAAKYAIDAHLGDAASGYFNVIFMPTSVINLAAGFVIRPFLTYLTDCWNEHRFSDFKKKLLTIMAVIGGLTVLAVGGTVVLGRPVLALLEWLLGKSYSGTLTALWPAFIMIVLGGGFYAVLNLYYYALVILRRQKLIFGIYAVLTVLAAILAPRLTVALGIFGAAFAYLILMIVMAAGFVGGAWFEIQKEIREVRHDS